MDFWSEWLFWVFFAIALVGATIMDQAIKPKGEKNALIDSFQTMIAIAAAISVVLAFVLVTWQGGLVTIGAAIAGLALGEMISGRTYKDYEY